VSITSTMMFKSFNFKLKEQFKFSIIIKVANVVAKTYIYVPTA